MNALKVLDGAGMDRGITVLAAAYNGRDYIEEQMDSILAQGQGGILLVVSDDGSSDGTGVLLDRYGLKHRDRVLILHRRTGSGGAAAHFLGLLKMMASLAAGKGKAAWEDDYDLTPEQGERLIRAASSDYFMLIDQDDVWLPCKAQMHLRNMQELEGIISDPETEGTGLKDALTILSQSLADFGEQPYQETNANITLNAVKGITHILNEYDSKLKNAMQEQKDDLAASVKDINGKLKQLAELNKSIVHEVFVSDDLDGVSYGPNDLLDQRNVILDDLSRYGNVSVTEGGDGRIQVKFNGKTVVDSSGHQFTSDELLIGPDGVTLTWNSDNSGMHLENGALKAYTDVITGNAPGNAGIPYYQQKLDDFAAAFGELMNNTIHEDDGTAVFKTLIEAEGGGALTAGNISVSTAWAEDPSYVIRDQNPDGTLDNTDIMKLKAGLTEERTFGKEYRYSGNFSGFITNYTDTLGSDIKTTKARLNASLAIAESVEKDRQGVSGVSLNEEGINLMTYNKAFQALGRLMTTMDEQLDMIINQMGMVGR